jgi:hypothetical protein
MEHDHGWINHLLQEAENERMHLFFFLTMRNPGVVMRSSICVAQLLWYNFFFAFYFISPKTAHRFVGYLEEEAVHTYTVCIDCLDKGRLPIWANMKATPAAAEYYALDKDASFRDMLLNVRADEACHRSVNHHFSDIPSYYDINHDSVNIAQDGFKHVSEDDLQEARSMLLDNKDAIEKEER